MVVYINLNWVIYAKTLRIYYEVFLDKQNILNNLHHTGHSWPSGIFRGKPADSVDGKIKQFNMQKYRQLLIKVIHVFARP